MWYFAWLLGVLLALAFGVINVMWYEAEQYRETEEKDIYFARSRMRIKVDRIYEF